MHIAKRDDVINKMEPTARFRFRIRNQHTRQKRRGRLYDYSPLFIAEPRQDEVIIHGGTLFDYVFTIDRKFPKLSWVRTYESKVKEIANRKEVLHELERK